MNGREEIRRKARITLAQVGFKVTDHFLSSCFKMAAALLSSLRAIRKWKAIKARQRARTTITDRGTAVKTNCVGRENRPSLRLRNIFQGRDRLLLVRNNNPSLPPLSTINTSPLFSIATPEVVGEEAGE